MKIPYGEIFIFLRKTLDYSSFEHTPPPPPTNTFWQVQKRPCKALKAQKGPHFNTDSGQDCMINTWKHFHILSSLLMKISVVRIQWEKNMQWKAIYHLCPAELPVKKNKTFILAVLRKIIDVGRLQDIFANPIPYSSFANAVCTVLILRCQGPLSPVSYLVI